MNTIINKILELNQTGLKEYLGNYNYYVEKKKNPLRFQIEEEQAGMSKTQINSDKKKKRDQEKLEKQKKLDLKNLENRISSLEEQLIELQNDLCLEEVYSNPSKSEETNKRISTIEKELEELYSVWESSIEELE